MGLKVSRSVTSTSKQENPKHLNENFSDVSKKAYLDAGSGEAYIFDSDLDEDEVLQALQDKFAVNGYDSEQAISLAEKVLENEIDLFEWR